MPLSFAIYHTNNIAGEVRTNIPFWSSLQKNMTLCHGIEELTWEIKHGRSLKLY